MSRIDTNDSKLIKTISFASLAFVVLVGCLFYLKPVAYIHLIAEDSWGEYGTFVCYFIAWVLMVATMVRDRRYLKPGFLLLSFCLLFMAMEEISWGQRILGLQTPEAYGAINRQGETTLHNLVRVNRLLRILSIVIVLWATVLPQLIRRYGWVETWVKKLGIPVASRYLWPLFILALFFIVGRPLPRAVEVGELVLGVAFLAHSFDTWRGSRKSRGVAVRPLGRAVAFLVVWVVAGSSFFVANWPNDHAMRLRLCDFAIDELPERDLQRQAESILRHVILEPEYMTVEFLATLDRILKNGKREGETWIDHVVSEFLSTDDIRIGVHGKRKAFNMRRSDIDEHRARLLFEVGVDYYQLAEFQTAARYFNSSLAYTREPVLIGKNQAYISGMSAN